MEETPTETAVVTVAQPPKARLLYSLGATAAAGVIAAALLGGLALGRQPSAATSPGHGQLASNNSPSTSNGATVTVTSTGQAMGAPDTVTLQMGVTANGLSAATTLDRANSEMNALEKIFLSHGVGKSQLQTSNLNVNPNYNNVGQPDGYQASEELTITMHDITKAGSLIDLGSHAVGNDAHVDGITFSISKTSGLLASARADAMRNAHLQAQQIATGAGVSLGAIKSVVDLEQAAPQPIFYGAVAAQKAASAAVPLQGGQQQLSIQVQVVYFLGS